MRGKGKMRYTSNFQFFSGVWLCGCVNSCLPGTATVDCRTVPAHRCTNQTGSLCGRNLIRFPQPQLSITLSLALERRASDATSGELGLGGCLALERRASDATSGELGLGGCLAYHCLLFQYYHRAYTSQIYTLIALCVGRVFQVALTGTGAAMLVVAFNCLCVPDQHLMGAEILKDSLPVFPRCSNSHETEIQGAPKPVGVGLITATHQSHLLIAFLVKIK
ncbi:hypothetical protein RRG08_010916 [Elysia crispata]|uniref:Uncharacterized protein n=1 Tax=Elysia crispata TaxID=231223 RepID=A0AAE1DQ01_9GAST|nr:hypothetical protein RRG08_010916 [Elysia crispata]